MPLAQQSVDKFLTFCLILAFKSMESRRIPETYGNFVLSADEYAMTIDRLDSFS
jgi:hypothetical protein